VLGGVDYTIYMIYHISTLTKDEDKKMSQTNERFAVEFYNNKGDMEFACGIVNIDDVLKMKDPCRKAMVFDMERMDSFRNPVAVFEKLPKERKWTKVS